jgi:hypothetical protein
MIELYSSMGLIVFLSGSLGKRRRADSSYT